jgi:hypothetical protein
VAEVQDANNTSRIKDRVTISEAATLLDCHPNTVRNRVKAGVYRAEKVLTDRGPTWMIDRDSLTANAPTSDSKLEVARFPQEALTILAREIVREAGLSRDPERELAEKRWEQFIEGGREHWKAQIDYYKHIATASSATIVAETVVVSAFLREYVKGEGASMLVGSLILLLAAAILSLVLMNFSSTRLVRYSWKLVPDWKPEWEEGPLPQGFLASNHWSRFIPTMLYYMGLAVFAGLVVTGLIPWRLEL